MNHRYSTRKMIDVHRHRRKNSHQMKRSFLVNRRRRRSNPVIRWTYGGWWAIISRPFGYYYQFGGHRSLRVWCYHGVIEAVLGRKCHSSFVAAFKCVSVVEDEECFVCTGVHTLSFQVHEAYVKYGNIDFLYVRILCDSLTFHSNGTTY